MYCTQLHLYSAVQEHHHTVYSLSPSLFYTIILASPVRTLHKGRFDFVLEIAFVIT